jgi:uncharacterized protein YvpB
MIGFLKWMIGLGLLVAIGIGAGIFLAFHGTSSITYITPDLVPLDANAASASPGAQTPSPINLPAAVILPVPFTSQAPLNDWANKQHTCEEANLVMVDRYLHGDHSGALIDPRTADAAINTISAWKPTLDMVPANLGQLAHQYLGWAYQVLPADRINIKTQLALGRPVIVGVRTHGLGNPNYPGYKSHYEQPGWSVSHYITVVGYDTSDQVILNDPGLTRGHGYAITFSQLFYAIQDLDQAYPELNAGLVILVLAPAAAA